MENEVKIFYKFKIKRSEKYVCGFCGTFTPLYYALKDKLEDLKEDEKARVFNDGFVAFYPTCPHCLRQANFFIVLELESVKSASIKTLNLKLKRTQYDN